MLKREADLSGHQVFLFPSMDAALQGWTAGCRSSPIFPSRKGMLIPPLDDGKTRWIYFLGLTHAGLIPPTYETYLTLGLFNIMIFTEVDSRKKLSKDLARLGCANWECWKLQGHQLIDREYQRAAGAPANAGKPISGLPSDLRPAFTEYRTLLATTAANCEQWQPKLAEEIRHFEAMLKERLQRSDAHAVEKQSWLVNINAALSRFTSQTFAGISPIIETECHFWTHSLLGVGLATQALWKLRRFIARAGARAQLVDRLERMSKVAPQTVPLNKLSIDHPFWKRDPGDEATLAENAAVEAIKPQTPQAVQALEAEVLPLFVCFSGRDGFRSTLFTLSAALEVITSCNTRSWSLITVTHELTHVFVDGLLGALLNGRDTDTSVEQWIATLDGAQPCDSLFGQIRAELIHSFIAIDRLKERTPVSQGITINPDSLRRLLNKLRNHVSEIVTHILDFQYFYQADVSDYLKSVWASWDVIPNIQDRMEDYIDRSLCAALSNNLFVDERYEISVSQVKDCLQSLRAPHTQYITQALALLETDAPRFIDSMKAHLPLVKLTYRFLVSADVKRHFEQEHSYSGGAYAALKPGKFETSQRIDNPLQFVLRFTDDKSTDEWKSYWMLHQMAFAHE